MSRLFTAPSPRRRRKLLRATIVLVIALTSLPAEAHEGPPFPILVDEPVGPWSASVWTDPDIGIGTFYVVLEPAGDAEVPVGTRVRIGVRPVSERLEEALYEARQERVRYGERHVVEVEFDRGEEWDVRVLIDAPGGGGELLSRVEATPDGTIGPIGMIFYMLPFLAVGFIWIRVALRKRELVRETRKHSSGDGSTD